MADSELRQRKAAQDSSSPKTRSSIKVNEEEKYTPWLDTLRVVTFCIMASCGLSYIISGGNSWFWGGEHQPQYLRAEWWKSVMRGPLYLTPEELAGFDGQNPEKPVYIAINHTIYDVSNGRHIYGPGGSYNYFAGVDASRAYVTGCFADDRTPDMRGVEVMFLPVANPEVEAYYSEAEITQMKVDELVKAHEKVYKGLKHWVDFFANSRKYNKVGYVKLEDGWLEKQEPRELCASAIKGRPKRKIPKK